jgi:CheY-like chemotaxis protein
MPSPTKEGGFMKKAHVILVVDDEKDITETYKMLLEFYNYRVVIANNGIDALTVIADTPPDLILSDCMMPQLDGVEFSRRARLIPGLEAIPIILMSGAPELHDLSANSHTLFLHKPLLFDRLILEIEKLLQVHVS